MPIWKVLASIGFQAVLFTSLGVALWVLAERSYQDFVTLAWNEAANGVLLAFALIAASAIMAKTFPRYAEWVIRAQARTYSFLKDRISFAAIIFISICAGVGEEALFRGGLQTLLGEYAPLPLALVVSAALFALIHFAQPAISVLLFVIGCLFGWIYWQTGSLLTVMVGHTVYDVYAIWALQKAMHELDVFDDHRSADLLEESERETLTTANKTTGETS
ncbi:MAG: type II CAAX endopeptidase family protein [Pseudomonadota bacterium]